MRGVVARHSPLMQLHAASEFHTDGDGAIKRGTTLRSLRPPRRHWICRTQEFVVFVTQLDLGHEATWVSGVADASGLHIGKYRAQPA